MNPARAQPSTLTNLEEKRESVDCLLLMHDTVAPLGLGLCRDLVKSVFQVVARIGLFARPNNHPRRIAEKMIHLLERAAGSLGQ